ncbi:MAG: hypothetical protein IPL61_13325 [Myxococcales bacterium]|nr:hypothetical protein [Myxococcales bacterium]
MTTPPARAKPSMRNPNIVTTPAKEEDANPRRGREVERPQGPGETGPEMIPPGRVRTGRSGGADAGEGDAGDDERDSDSELVDRVDLPASDQDTGRHAQPAKAPTRGDEDAAGTRSPTRGDDATDRSTRDPRR